MTISLTEVAESIFDEYGTTRQTEPQTTEPARGGDVSVIIRAEGGIDLFLHDEPHFDAQDIAELKAMSVYAVAIRALASNRELMIDLMASVLHADEIAKVSGHPSLTAKLSS